MLGNFRGLNPKSKTLEYKIQTPQTLEDEFQIQKLQGVKSKHPQTLGV